MGLPLYEVYFLGYADRSLKSLCTGNWKRDRTVKASYTYSISNPYALNYTPGALYCGSVMLADFQAILSEHQPDFIVLPHPSVGHPDHSAASNFTRMAVLLQSYSDPDYSPRIYGYIVHYGPFPQPHGFHQDQNEWVRTGAVALAAGLTYRLISY